MRGRVGLTVALLCAFGLATESAFAQWETVWELGAPGRGWPQGSNAGGPDVNFVQEAGVNDPPGDPNSPAENQQADDDYYFAGEYPDPIGVVENDEIAMERAFAGIDNNLRIHFNLPEGMSPDAAIRFTLEPFNLHQDAAFADPRYGVQVFFNDVLIAPERLARPDDLNTLFTSDPITLSEVNAVFGPGGDNVVLVQGINYNDDGGGNWMGIDYHALEVNPQGAPAEAPTMTEWGMILMALAFIAGGSLCIRRRRQPASC